MFLSIYPNRCICGVARLRRQAKATFKAALVVDAHLTCFSNMPEDKSESVAGGVRRKPACGHTLSHSSD